MNNGNRNNNYNNNRRQDRPAQNYQEERGGYQRKQQNGTRSEVRGGNNYNNNNDAYENNQEDESNQRRSYKHRKNDSEEIVDEDLLNSLIQKQFGGNSMENPTPTANREDNQRSQQKKAPQRRKSSDDDNDYDAQESVKNQSKSQSNSKVQKENPKQYKKRKSSDDEDDDQVQQLISKQIANQQKPPSSEVNQINQQKQTPQNDNYNNQQSNNSRNKEREIESQQQNTSISSVSKRKYKRKVSDDEESDNEKGNKNNYSEFDLEEENNEYFNPEKFNKPNTNQAREMTFEEQFKSLKQAHSPSADQESKKTNQKSATADKEKKKYNRKRSSSEDDNDVDDDIESHFKSNTQMNKLDSQEQTSNPSAAANQSSSSLLSSSTAQSKNQKQSLKTTLEKQVYSNIHQNDSKFHSYSVEPEEDNTEPMLEQSFMQVDQKKINKSTSKEKENELDEEFNPDEDSGHEGNLSDSSEESKESSEEEDSDDDEDFDEEESVELINLLEQANNESFGDCQEEIYFDRIQEGSDMFVNEGIDKSMIFQRDLDFCRSDSSATSNSNFQNKSNNNNSRGNRSGGEVYSSKETQKYIDSQPKLRDKEYTSNIESHLKRLISDEFQYPDPTSSNITGDLNDTVKKVADYVMDQMEERAETLKSLENQLKKFIFDYRYDQFHEPRKYQSQNASNQRMKIKFNDPRFDQRKIIYTIAGQNSNPFSFFANDVDIYVYMETNEQCMKNAYFEELDSYLRAVLRGKADVQSNHLTEQRIYFQCLTLFFHEKKLTVRIRIQQKQSNIYQSRDNIFLQYYSQNPSELGVFATFVLYWAQKRKIISTECVDKSAWYVWIINFFQSINRLPQATNYEMLAEMAKDVEERSHSVIEAKHRRNKPTQEKSSIRTDFNHLKNQQPSSYKSMETPNPNKGTPGGGETPGGDGDSEFGDNSKHLVRSPNDVLQFDFEKFKENQEKQTKFKFIVTFRQIPKSAIRDPTKAGNDLKKSYLRQVVRSQMMQFNVLPLTQPNENQNFKVDPKDQVNFGVLFQKFIFYLKSTILVSPLAVTLTGQIFRKKFYNGNIPLDPIIICDPVFPDMNLVSHLSNSLDAFNYLLSEIELVQRTLQDKKSPKIFLQEVVKPVFSKPLGFKNQSNRYQVPNEPTYYPPKNKDRSKHY